MQLMPEEGEFMSKKENPIVEDIIEEPMDDGDIRSYFPNAKVLRYADLADYDSIQELLPASKSYAFLLYQHRPNDGHFTCLMRYGNTVEFCFDVREFTDAEKIEAMTLLGHKHPPMDKDAAVTIHPPTNVAVAH